MEPDTYSFFHGIVHPPGKKSGDAIESITYDMTHDQVKDLDLNDYAITEGHPPDGDSVTKHMNLVRGRVIHQYMDDAGNKWIIGKISHGTPSGMRTLLRIESGKNASLSLGHRFQVMEDENGKITDRFLGDHIAIVDEPLRPGCHIHGLARADRIDMERVTIAQEQLFGKVTPDHPKPEHSLIRSESTVNNRESTMDASQQTTMPVAGSTAMVPSHGLQQQQQQAQQQQAQQAQQLVPVTPQQQQMLMQQQIQQQQQHELQQQQQQQQMMDQQPLTQQELMMTAYRATAEKKMLAEKLERAEAALAEQKKKEQETDISQWAEALNIFKAVIDREAERGDERAKRAAEKLKPGPESVAKAMYGEGDGVDGRKMLLEVVGCAGAAVRNQMMEQDRRFEELYHKRMREPGMEDYMSVKRPMISDFKTVPASLPALAGPASVPMSRNAPPGAPYGAAPSSSMSSMPSMPSRSAEELNFAEMTAFIRQHDNPNMLRDAAKGDLYGHYAGHCKQLHPPKAVNYFAQSGSGAPAPGQAQFMRKN